MPPLCATILFAPNRASSYTIKYNRININYNSNYLRN
jgi:hypothetical protein